MVFASALLFAALFIQVISASPSPAQDGLIEDPGAKARRLCAAKQYKDCLEFVEPVALGPEKNNPEVQFYYASMLKYFRRFDEAKTHFEEVLRLAPYGWMESRSKSNLAEIKDLQAKGAGGGSSGIDPKFGYTGIKLKDNIILQVLAGSTAEKARLIAGDKVVGIDGIAAGTLSADQVANRIRGPVGSKVNLVIERQGKQYTVPVLRGPFPGQLASVGASQLTADTATLPSTGSAGASARNSSDAKLSAGDPKINILRRTADTDAVYKEIVSTMLIMPESIRSALGAYGISVQLTPTLLEAMPEMATERPRGYSHGGTYVNCAGLYKSGVKTLYVTERVQAGNHVAHLNTNMSHTVLHEFGHAYDDCRNVSHSEKFISAYQADSGRLTNSVREHFYYYTQEGDAGPCELFAQLFSCAVVPQNSINTDNLNLIKTFPTCYEQVKRVVSAG